MGGKFVSDVNGVVVCNGGGKYGDICLKIWILVVVYQFGLVCVYGLYLCVKLLLMVVCCSFDLKFESFVVWIDLNKKIECYDVVEKGDYIIGGVNNELSQILDLGVNYWILLLLFLISSL